MGLTTKRRNVQAWILGALMVALVAWSDLRAAENLRAAERLPAETYAYGRIRNTRELVEGLRETALGQALEDPQVSPLVKELWGSVTPMLERFESEAGVGLDELLVAAPGELVVAAVAMPEQPVAPVLMFRADENDPAWEILRRGEGKLVERGFSQATESLEGIELQILATDSGPVEEILQLQLDNWRVITTNRLVAAAMVGIHLGRPVPVLADEPSYRAIMARCVDAKDAPHGEWYADPLKLAKAAFRGNFAAAAGLALLPAIGADGLQAIGGQLTLSGQEFDLLTRTHLLLEPPRDGVFEVLALGAGSFEPEPWVPADVATYVTWKVEPQQAYQALRTLVESFRGEGAVKRFLDRSVGEQLGVDFEKELLPIVQGRFTQIVRFPAGATIETSHNAFSLELTDAAQADAVLDKIVAKWSERIERQSFGGVELLELKRTGEPQDGAQNGDDDAESSERRRRRRGGPPQWSQANPVAAIVGNYLLVANQREVLEQCIMAFHDSAPRLKDELDYKLVVSKLRRQSTTPPSMVRFERPEQGMRVMYDLLQSPDVRQRLHERREQNPFFAALDDAIQQNRLPAFAVIAQYLAPSGAAIFNEESGIYHVQFGLRRAAPAGSSAPKGSR